MRLVLLSDTHAHPLKTWALPEADGLIHSGDFCQGRNVTLDSVRFFNDEMAALPYEHKLLVAGNHDLPLDFEGQKATELLTAVTYLQDNSVTINGIKFYGSPWQPDHRFWAFNLQRHSIELKSKWDAVPDDTDVLITHTPPFGILDFSNSAQESVGCESLRRRLEYGLNPMLHIFGHVHEGRGFQRNNSTLHVNAASLSLTYEPYPKPVVVDIDPVTRTVTVVDI